MVAVGLRPLRCVLLSDLNKFLQAEYVLANSHPYHFSISSVRLVSNIFILVVALFKAFDLGIPDLDNIQSKNIRSHKWITVKGYYVYLLVCLPM